MLKKEPDLSVALLCLLRIEDELEYELKNELNQVYSEESQKDIDQARLDAKKDLASEILHTMECYGFRSKK